METTVLRVKENPSDLQTIICNEHRELMSEKQGFLFDINGRDVHVVMLDDKGNVESYSTISVNPNHPNLVDFDDKGNYITN